MENASKALLIAGAVLIAILIIAVSMVIFNRGNSVVDSAAANMSTQEKEMFNKQWTIYNGTQTGSIVSSIKTAVDTNNANEETTDITLTLPDTTIVRTKQYNVEVTIDSTTGLVNAITVTE